MVFPRIAICRPDDTPRPVASARLVERQARCRVIRTRQAIGQNPGVLNGLITQEEALERYALSEDEFREWVWAVSRHGEEALKATSVQKFRQS